MTEREKIIRGVIRNLRRTYKNKICGLALIGIGLLSMTISDDATALVFLLMFGLPLLFARENYIL